MTTAKAGRATLPDRTGGRIEHRGVALIAIALAWFYFWTATSATHDPSFELRTPDPYNLLADAFLSGRLDLEVPADAAPGLSVHQGKYYLSSGPAPLVLILPWRVFFGFSLPSHLAAVIFCTAGCWISLALMLRLCGRYFPELGTKMVWLSALVLGLVNMAPALLRRPGTSEVAIACGYCFAMLAFHALVTALTATRGRLRWLAIASMACGFAILARPSYLAGAMVFLLVLGGWFWRERAGRTARDWCVTLLAGIAPLAVLIATALLYNHARFGNAFAFDGAALGKVKEFSGRYVSFNAWLYFLMPADLGCYFPFFLRTLPPPKPPGYGEIDDVFGVLPNLPVYALALGALAAGWARDRRTARELKFFCLFCAAGFVAVTGGFLFFSRAAIRYYVDFLPLALPLVCVGAWTILRVGSGRRWWKFLVTAPLVLLASWSIAFATMVSFRHGGWLRATNPAAFDVLAMVFNHVPWLGEKTTGVRFGPLRVDLTFPRDRAGKFEPLFESGNFPEVDVLGVFYTDDQHIQIGYEHVPDGRLLSAPIAVDYAKSHAIEIDAGICYPPGTHPYFFGRRNEASGRANALLVRVDGVTCLDRLARRHDPTTATPRFGRRSPGTGEEKFTGRLHALRRLPTTPVVDRRPQAGVARLRLIFPTDRSGTREPLVVTGETGRGDILFVDYVDARHVRFGLDHWGFALVQTDTVEIVPDVPQELEVSLGSLFPESAQNRRLNIRLNGTLVIDRETDFHPAAIDSQTFGENKIGGSTAGPIFTGKILGVSRRAQW